MGSRCETVTVPVQLSEVNRQGGATQRYRRRSSRVPRVERARLPRRVRGRRGSEEDSAKRDRRQPSKNIFPEFIDIAGPYRAGRAADRPQAGADAAIRRTGRACVDRILTTLARRAYRRPVQRAEVTALLACVRQGRRRRGTRRARALQFALAAMLVSPQFLFRIERDPGHGVIAPVSDVELASRLSYFLWSSMPDERPAAAGREEPAAPAGVLDARGQADARRSEGGGARRQLRRAVARDAKPRCGHAGSHEVPDVESRAARRDARRRRGCSSTRCCARTGRSRTSSTASTRS